MFLAIYWAGAYLYAHVLNLTGTEGLLHISGVVRVGELAPISVLPL